MISANSKFVGFIRILRPLQWMKNLVCFAGILFSGLLFEPCMFFRASLAFFGFSLISSAVYVLNDCFDVKKDRLNPRTANRPLASGNLSVPLGILAFISAFFGSLLISSYLGKTCLFLSLIYFISNLLYSLRLKRTVIADVMSIALGFVLRVLYGVYAVSVIPSPWIIICMFFLALLLGFGKRRGEIEDQGEFSSSSRNVLSKYTLHYLDMVLGVSATATIVAYTMFSLSPHHDATMVITVFPVVYCVFRYTYKVVVEGLGQSPERLIFKDKMMWLGVGSWVLLCVMVIYFKVGIIAFPS